ncbi:hypothetical protein AVEN_202531-1 [Araneus ventricosus]|uniref:Uncharacterized protein n=1 Tax=Araneus ventricosus TaxID=182803 RepID=A0A4Y2U4F9_ARAVE|nr:hypothetical protein AVEN_202531-1 [Araneus ventricosus]
MDTPKEVLETNEDRKSDNDFLPRDVETYKEELAARVDLLNKAIELSIKSWRGAVAADENSKSDSNVITKATDSLKDSIIAYVDLMNSTKSLREGLVADKDYKRDNVVVANVLGSFKQTINTILDLMTKSTMNAVRSMREDFDANVDAEATESLRERLIANVYFINDTVINDMESSREQLLAIEDSKSDNEAV